VALLPGTGGAGERTEAAAMQKLDREVVCNIAELIFPRKVRGWLPFLWSKILFPGHTPREGPVRFGAVFLLLVIPATLLYPGIGIHLFEPDEGRYAEIPREMLQRGEWIIPYLEGEPYLDKPPLLYWLVGLSYRLFGVHDWSARLVPALAVHGCVLLVYGLGRRILGERPAFWGALLLSLAPGFMSMGRLLILDGLLAFWVLLAWLAAYEAVCSRHTNPDVSARLLADASGSYGLCPWGSASLRVVAGRSGCLWAGNPYQGTGRAAPFGTAALGLPVLAGKGVPHWLARSANLHGCFADRGSSLVHRHLLPLARICWLFFLATQRAALPGSL
jgi:hypothetical protein